MRNEVVRRVVQLGKKRFRRGVYARFMMEKKGGIIRMEWREVSLCRNAENERETRANKA